MHVKTLVLCFCILTAEPRFVTSDFVCQDGQTRDEINFIVYRCDNGTIYEPLGCYNPDDPDTIITPFDANYYYRTSFKYNCFQANPNEIYWDIIACSINDDPEREVPIGETLVDNTEGYIYRCYRTTDFTVSFEAVPQCQFENSNGTTEFYQNDTVWIDGNVQYKCFVEGSERMIQEIACARDSVVIPAYDVYPFTDDNGNVLYSLCVRDQGMLFLIEVENYQCCPEPETCYNISIMYEYNNILYACELHGASVRGYEKACIYNGKIITKDDFGKPMKLEDKWRMCKLGVGGVLRFITIPSAKSSCFFNGTTKDLYTSWNDIKPFAVSYACEWNKLTEKAELATKSCVFDNIIYKVNSDPVIVDGSSYQCTYSKGKHTWRKLTEQE